jgi:hypothetical protein
MNTSSGAVVRRATTGAGSGRSAVDDGPRRPATTYEIRVRGELDPRWSSWFDGLHVECARPGETVIVGPVADQAALHGVLARVRDLGMPLLSVRVVEERDG